ncbi:MAG: N-6 DNA methylase [Candidatus Competibacter sp.]
MVFTRREVVDFILDLIGYTTNQPLHRFRLIEPAFGNGGFLLPIVERLLTAYRAQVQNHSTIVADLSAAVRAVEVHGDSIERTRAELLGTLQKHGITTEEAQKLLTAWIIEGDFLLVDIPQTFTHAVGNPPYVRQELIPDALMAQYRARYRTIYDRADLYVPFIERCLTHLQPGGALSFICADRWMKIQPLCTESA